jgi:hypothetical protein
MSARRRIFCVGMAKSGTHSVAEMFGDGVRSKHEPTATELLRRILLFLDGRIAGEDLTSYIRERDKALCLDIDSSQLNFFVLDILVREFPTARFVLTVRDPYSWLNSFIDDSLRRTTSADWIRLRDVRFRRNTFRHPREEQALQEHGLYTLDGYLSYWTMHNDKVLSSIPREQLLVLQTDQITERAGELADFAGVARSSIRLGRSHAFKNPQKFGILQKIDRNYLQRKVTLHCGQLMQRFFPETKGAVQPRISRADSCRIIPSAPTP